MNCHRLISRREIVHTTNHNIQYDDDEIRNFTVPSCAARYPQHILIIRYEMNTERPAVEREVKHLAYAKRL